MRVNQLVGARQAQVVRVVEVVLGRVEHGGLVDADGRELDDAVVPGVAHVHVAAAVARQPGRVEEVVPAVGLGGDGEVTGAGAGVEDGDAIVLMLGDHQPVTRRVRRHAEDVALELRQVAADHVAVAIEPADSRTPSMTGEKFYENFLNQRYL